MQKQKLKLFSKQMSETDSLSTKSEKGFINEPIEEWPQWSVVDQQKSGHQ